MNTEPETKRKRFSPLSTSDFMEEARIMWRIDNSKRCDKSEDRDFLVYF